MNLDGLITGGNLNLDHLNESLSQSGVNIQGLSMESILFGIVISIVGLAYFVYGKKNNRYMPIISGIIMMVFPYFVYDIKYMMIISILVCLLPLFIKV